MKIFKYAFPVSTVKKMSSFASKQNFGSVVKTAFRLVWNKCFHQFQSMGEKSATLFWKVSVGVVSNATYMTLGTFQARVVLLRNFIVFIILEDWVEIVPLLSEEFYPDCQKCTLRSHSNILKYHSFSVRNKFLLHWFGIRNKNFSS